MSTVINHIFFFIFLMANVFSIDGKSLDNNVKDSLKNKIGGCCGCLGVKVKPVVSFGGYSSFPGKIAVKIAGIKLGVELSDKYKFGVAAYSLTEPVTVQRRNQDTISEVDFSFGGLFFEYVFYENYKWELSIPLDVGNVRGIINKKYHLPNQTEAVRKLVINPKETYVLNTSFMPVYKFLPWIGAGFGTGYRRFFSPDATLNSVASGFYYQFRLKLMIGQLYRYYSEPVKMRQERLDYEESRKLKKNNQQNIKPE